MQVWAIYLRHKSSVSGWLASDTIFGAICWTIRLLEGEQTLHHWLERCQSDPPEWFVSSSFPFIDIDSRLHFLPKPLVLNPDAETVAKVAGVERKKLLEVMKRAKAIGKATYISETLLAKALVGKLSAQSLLEKVLEGEIEIKGGCILTSSELSLLPSNLWSTTDIQHTAVDRVLTSAAEGLLYFDTEHFFSRRVGLFFLLRCPDDFPVEPIVRFWKHDGLGGNRSVGKGHFDVTAQRADDWLNNLQPANGNAVTLISLCIPKLGEFDPSKSVYRIAVKRPKFESAFGQPSRVYKGTLRFVAEGSSLTPKQLKDAYGHLVKIGEQRDFEGISYPVYHNGIGFAMRMVMPSEVE